MSAERVSAEAAACRVVDLEGNEHRLDALWADAPAMLVFLRHFG